MKKCVVLGGGGFIGGHLTERLVDEGNRVIAVDRKPTGAWHQLPEGATWLTMNVATDPKLPLVLDEADEVYLLAADMGGMGFIEQNKLACMLTVNTSTAALAAAHVAGVGRLFYSSSACVYAAGKQTDRNNPGLKESDAYPADAEDGYGWEKLFTERLCRHYAEEQGLETRVARYHNIFGPKGTWKGGREKAPAALCRKIAEAKLAGTSTIEVWGDGEQTRTFLYIDDCIDGTLRLMREDNWSSEPINIGSDDLISINNLAYTIGEIADIPRLEIKHIPGFLGVRGRSSDNTFCKEILGWEPAVDLDAGLSMTYDWIANEVKKCALHS